MEQNYNEPCDESGQSKPPGTDDPKSAQTTCGRGSKEYMC